MKSQPGRGANRAVWSIKARLPMVANFRRPLETVSTIQGLALFQRGIGARALSALNLYDLVSVRKLRPVEFQYAVTALSMEPQKPYAEKSCRYFGR